MKRIGWLIAILVVVVGAGFLYYRAKANNQASAAANIQTAAVQRGNITASLTASGTVRASQSAVIPWQTSGRVGKVDVKVGDQVQANQELAALDPSQLPPSILNAQQALITAKKTLESLQDSSTVTAQAQQALAQAQQALTTAQGKRLALNAGQLGTQAAVDQAHADLLLQQSSVDSAQQHFDHMAHLPDTSLKKAQAQSKLSAAQQKLTTDQANYNSLTSPATPEDIALADAAVAVAKAQLQDAQTQWDKVQNGPSAEDVAAAQAAVAAAQATLDQAQLKAPFAGTITNVSVKPGDLVSSSTQAFRIDDLSGIYVDLQVAEVDVNSLKVGQQAELTFDAIPNKTYHGKVTEIGVVGAASQGVVNYPVTVQLTDADGSVKSGMTAAVGVTIAQHDNVLIVPNQAIRVSGGQRTVTVLFEGQQIQVPVTVGLTNETESEVMGNQLREGDEVVLNNSASTASNGANGGAGGGGFFRTFGGGGGPGR